MTMTCYAGHLTGLYPIDPIEVLKVDMLFKTLNEKAEIANSINWRTPDATEKAEKIKTFAEQDLPKLFGFLEKSIKGTYFLGEKATLADVFLFNLINNAFKIIYPKLTIASYPKMDAIVASVAANKGIAAFTRVRPIHSNESDMSE